MTLAPALLLVLAGAPDAGTPVSWQKLAEGVELTTVLLDPNPTYGDGLMQVVRIDPEKAELKFGLATANGGTKRTAGTWSDQLGFVAAINAGMFATDHKSNVGYLVDGAHVNNKQWSSNYKSVLAFGPKKKGIPAAVFLDLDAPGAQEQVADYTSAVQNLRLLKGGAENVWKASGKRWSEAAVGVDSKGRVLFLFSRSPVEMFTFNNRLKELPLDIQRAMHVEGGPEASLSIRSPGQKLDLCGSYETSFTEHDRNHAQWDLPNVLGVVAKPTSAPPAPSAPARPPKR